MTSFGTKVVIVLLILLTQGCASTPTKKLEVAENAKIGVMFRTNENPLYVHVGTTMFQNETRFLDESWELEAYTIKYLESALKPDVSVELINSEALTSANQIVDAGWSSLTLTKELEPELSKLASERNLSVLLIIDKYEASVEANSTVTAEGYGVFTRCMLGICHAEPLRNVAVRVFSLDPAMYITSGNYTNSVFQALVETELPNIPEKISPEAIEVVKNEFFTIFSKEIDYALERSGL
ncbi:hypothetical protein SNR37_000894 [Agarivorans aestuarii]|uniref:Lipoprotein n=1 Tax=Agarivorans aestuarii TaxID=1563703 RepID=A0ABU7G833_9ALTE|nr:hypothetical protein [Agarivorans aestuarii]MEE1675568.1 hypothetical protein [Agarivorans aestuarii]